MLLLGTWEAPQSRPSGVPSGPPAPLVCRAAGPLVPAAALARALSPLGWRQEAPPAAPRPAVRCWCCWSPGVGSSCAGDGAVAAIRWQRLQLASCLAWPGTTVGGWSAAEGQAPGAAPLAIVRGQGPGSRLSSACRRRRPPIVKGPTRRPPVQRVCTRRRACRGGRALLPAGRPACTCRRPPVPPAALTPPSRARPPPAAAACCCAVWHRCTPRRALLPLRCVKEGTQVDTRDAAATRVRHRGRPGGDGVVS